jgi:hypothetical protein
MDTLQDGGEIEDIRTWEKGELVRGKVRLRCGIDTRESGIWIVYILCGSSCGAPPEAAP